MRSAGDARTVELVFELDGCHALDEIEEELVRHVGANGTNAADQLLSNRIEPSILRPHLYLSLPHWFLPPKRIALSGSSC